MKKTVVLVIVLLVFTCVNGFAQVGTITLASIVEDAPTTVQAQVQSWIDRMAQITAAISTLATVNQSLQYQIRAAEALSEGSWDGFVDYFDYQTAAIAGFTSSVASLNDVDDEFFDAKEGGYASILEHAQNINRSMDAANRVVRSTDYVVEQSEYNAEAVERGFMNSANASNPLQALQAQGQIISAMASESRAVTQLLYAQHRYLQTLIDASEARAALNQAETADLMRAPDEFDPDNPYARRQSSDYIRRSLNGEYLDNSGGFVH
jgi:conjugal transfer/entry exclusion protein